MLPDPLHPLPGLDGLEGEDLLLLLEWSPFDPAWPDGLPPSSSPSSSPLSRSCLSLVLLLPELLLEPLLPELVLEPLLELP